LPPAAGFFIFKYRNLSFGINMKKRRVVIGVLGTVLDKRGKRANRFKNGGLPLGYASRPIFLSTGWSFSTSRVMKIWRKS
jgi:transcriptional regulatory protein RtcR